MSISSVHALKNSFARSATVVTKPLQTIILDNVPKSATPSDVSRAIHRQPVKGITNVELDYERFTPKGRAVITFSKEEDYDDNKALMKNVAVSGIPLKVASRKPVSASTLPLQFPTLQNRNERDEGALEGNGPSAGLGEAAGKTVVLWGFPGRSPAHVVAKILQNYRVAKSKEGILNIQKVALPERGFSLYSRFAVVLETESEAHRVVRDLHMQPWHLAGRSRSIIHGRVVY